MFYWRNTSPLVAVFSIIGGAALGVAGAEYLDGSGLTAESIVWKLLGGFGGVVLVGAVAYSVKKFFTDF